MRSTDPIVNDDGEIMKTSKNNDGLNKRADALKNYTLLLEVARKAVAQNGADASFREIAREAGVGLGTLYRHFPTREDLLETLLHSAWDKLIKEGKALASADDPDEALISWLKHYVEALQTYRGITTSVSNAYDDEKSPLYKSCTEMRASGEKLLKKAQAKGSARSDIDITEMIAIFGALVWLSEQPSIKDRTESLFNILLSSVFIQGSNATKQKKRKTSSAE